METIEVYGNYSVCYINLFLINSKSIIVQPKLLKMCLGYLSFETKKGIPDLGEVSMEAAILGHVHPLGPSFRPGGGQALPWSTVNLLSLYLSLQMIALEIHHQLN